MRWTLAVLAVLVLVLPACGGSGREWEDARLVERYCTYGSMTQAQWDGCVEHVTADEVRARDTPAARWAKQKHLDEDP